MVKRPGTSVLVVRRPGPVRLAEVQPPHLFAHPRPVLFAKERLRRVRRVLLGQTPQVGDVEQVVTSDRPCEAELEPVPVVVRVERRRARPGRRA
jgi:hypothetical protein